MSAMRTFVVDLLHPTVQISFHAPKLLKNNHLLGNVLIRGL